MTMLSDSGTSKPAPYWEWLDVRAVCYSVHHKRDAPPDHPRTMRVDYRIGHQQWVSEWVCFEHTGFPRQQAIAWWHKRSQAPLPRNIEEAVYIANHGGLADTTQVALAKELGSGYRRVVGHRLGSIPPWDATKQAPPQPRWMTAEEISKLRLPFDYTIINEEIL